MKKVLITAIVLAAGPVFINAVELESISAKDAVQMAQAAKVAVPEPALDRTAKAAKPITGTVDFKSPAFAELLINSLNVKPKLVVMAGGQSYVYKVGAGLTCYKSFANDTPTASQPRKAKYSCLISPEGGWKFMGMESYGSGDNREFSLALYAALKVKETNDEGMKSKALELQQPDSDGGTERNQMYCINPDPKMEAMGFRPTCQFINAL